MFKIIDAFTHFNVVLLNYYFYFYHYYYYLNDFQLISYEHFEHKKDKEVCGEYESWDGRCRRCRVTSMTEQRVNDESFYENQSIDHFIVLFAFWVRLLLKEINCPSVLVLFRLCFFKVFLFFFQK